ncbi:MAG: hypothetical protein AAGC43_12090 [Bacteroidota bacterium]
MKRKKVIIKKIVFLVLTGFLAFSCKQKQDKSTSSPNPFENEQGLKAQIFQSGNVSKLNSAEFGISFTPDMQSLFFTSNRENDKSFYIYSSKFVNGQWEEAKIASFSGNYFDADAFVTLDGEKLFFYSMRPIDENSTVLKSPNIWFIDYMVNGWGEAKYLNSKINQNTSGEGYMSISKNNTIYFSSVGREKGRKHDVYRSPLLFDNNSGDSIEFVNIDIETNYSNPYISSDESFIIIDSKQKGGFGENDLYISFREGEQWSLPKNLGPKVNTDKDEGTPYISPDGKWFFFSRDGDIYYIALSSLSLNKLK